MSILIKPDAGEIQKHIDSLCHAGSLDATRSWWPKFVYHFTNIDNALKILESGNLYSRSYCLGHGLMSSDNASQEIIDQTNERWKDYVRLYFRPRTPTQYQNEGYIPIEQRYQNAHCPVPIYFLFDSKQVLSLDGVCFSDCSLARQNSHVYSSAIDFKRIPFDLVYHDAYFDRYSTRGRDIIGHRQAEVIVPNMLNLLYLKYIWCRSEAEYQTLLYRLSGSALNRWKNKIGSGKKNKLFFRNWVFVEQAELNRTSAVFKFNESSHQCNSFPVRVEIIEDSTEIIYFWENSSYRLPDDSKLEFDLSNLKDPSNYEIKLLFDQQIMFMDRFEDLEYVPF